jgi:superfamily II DNA or RNA helicase
LHKVQILLRIFTMSETRTGADLLAERAERLRGAAEAYDAINYPGLEHLRPHQLEAVDAGLKYVSELTIEELQSPYGACILGPPGSGKTVTAAALVTALSTPDHTPRVLYFTPRNIIQEDTQQRFNTFAPGVDTFIYSSKRQGSGNACLMSYQSLGGAIDSGFIDKFDPDIIVDDEVHHVIDGEWASLFEKIAPGRIKWGMTATPAYKHSRTIRRLFPKVLAHKTFQEGLDEGFVSPFRSYMYRSQVRESGDYEGMTRDIFDALTLAQGYAKQGKVGIIACTPGDNTAHARSVESLAGLFAVGESQDPLKIFSVSGNMNPALVRVHINDLKKGRIHALSYTQMLGEGVDIPELDYMILLGWTKSVVLATQRLGRATRLGKITDVHEFHRPGYVSHLDAFNSDFNPDVVNDNEDIIAGKDTDGTAISKGSRRTFLLPNFAAIADSSRRIFEASPTFRPTAEKELLIGDGMERPAYDWSNIGQIAAKTMLPAAKVQAILENEGIVPTVVGVGNYRRELYRPEAMRAVIAHLNPERLSKDTHVSVQEAFRAFRSRGDGAGSFSSFLRLLAENGIERTLFIDGENNPVHGVLIEALDIGPQATDCALRGLASLTRRRQSRKAESATPAPDTPLPDAGSAEPEAGEKAAQVPDARSPRRDLASSQTVEGPAAPIVTLQRQVESFLISLIPPRQESAYERDKRQRKIANLRASLVLARDIPAEQLEIFARRAATLEPDSMAARNLRTMAEKQGIEPAQVLAAMARTMQNT